MAIIEIASEDNLFDPSNKTLMARNFERQIEIIMVMQNMSHLLI